jgi:membrane protein YdbS with pleckstrin-like domain
MSGLTAPPFWIVVAIIGLWVLTMAWRAWVAPRLIARRRKRDWRYAHSRLHHPGR